MKMTLRDGTVIDGTLEEVTSLVQAIQGKDAAADASGVPSGAQNGNAKSNGHQGTVVWTPDRARAFWDSLYGNKKKLLLLLLEKEEGARVPEIMKFFGFKKGVQLAGVRAGITRDARRETEYKKAHVVDWALGEDGHWRYKLAGDVRQLLMQIATEK